MQNLFKPNVQKTIKNSVTPEETTCHELEPVETIENKNRPAGALILR